MEKSVASDLEFTLMEWKGLIDSLIKEYGPQAVMRTDGGYNNVDLIVKYQTLTVKEKRAQIAKGSKDIVRYRNPK